MFECSFSLKGAFVLFALSIFFNSYFTDVVYPQNGTKITQGSIVNDDGHSGGCGWGDYDNDGYLDLFVANWEGQGNFLYKNNRNGTFAKITSGPVVNNAESSYNSSSGDYDNDGDVDLFVANFKRIQVSSGVYILRFQAGDYTKVFKMVRMN